MRCPRLIICLAAGLLCVAPPAVAETIHNLDDLSERLPYIVHVSGSDFLAGIGRHWPRTTACDLDRDGYDELLNAVGIGLIALDMEGVVPKILWQENFGARSSGGNNTYNLGPVVDVDGDGDGELLLTRRTKTPYAWRLWVVDPVSQRRKGDYPLPVGPDGRADADWGDHYYVCGVLPARSGRPAAALLCRQVYYNGRPRGVLAVDLKTGEVIWRFDLAPNPYPEDFWVGDLEGDGVLDIAFVGLSPDNLGGEAIGGESDDVCLLYVLDEWGRLRWKRRLGGIFFDASLAVADLDGDDHQELVTATWNHRVGENDFLSVWSAAGSLLARKVSPAPFAGLALAPARAGGSGSILTGSLGGTLSRFFYEEGRLDRACSTVARDGVRLLLRDDLIPEMPGDEVVVATAAGEFVVLRDEDFLPLASFSLPYRGVARARAWRPGDGPPLLVVESLASGIFRIAPGYGGGFPMWAVALVALPVLLAAFTWSLRRERKTLTLPPGLNSGLLSRVHRDLELVSHGALGTTRGLKRLIWQMEALSTPVGRSQRMIERTRQTISDYRETMLPRLCESLETAGYLKPGGVDAAAIEKDLLAVVEKISELARRDFPAGKIDAALPGIRKLCGEIETGLMSLRAAVAVNFSADLRKMTQRILLLHEEEIEQAAIEVACDLGPERAVICSIEPGDLRYIVDNLVNNAVRSMAGSERRRLSVRIDLDGDIASLTVGDTGGGMDEETRRNLFLGGRSHHGGGMGLMRSREILAAFGGDLSLIESDPGRGSTFALRLRRLDPARGGKR